MARPLDLVDQRDGVVLVGNPASTGCIAQHRVGSESENACALAGNELRTFLDSRLRTDALLASTPLETKVADAATDLRQAKAR